MSATPLKIRSKYLKISDMTANPCDKFYVLFYNFIVIILLWDRSRIIAGRIT